MLTVQVMALAAALIAVTVGVAAVIVLPRVARSASGAGEGRGGNDDLPAAYYHPRAECVPPCPIHAPTEHHMVEWPRSYHPDNGIFERQCGHGHWHPDPDSIGYVRRTRGDDDAWGVSVHTCACRCCVSPGIRCDVMP